MKEWISLKDVAASAGVSSMTVSRALRNDPRVAHETSLRIRQAAEKLGYQSDPVIRQMMGYMRKARVRRRSEIVAFIWPDISTREAAKHPQLMRLIQGATARAESMGFGLDQFALKDPGLSVRRLESILKNRAVQCVILAPVFNRAHGHLRFDWSRYASVTIGLGLWRPQLHRVHSDHYGSMTLVMRKLARLGHKRIVFIVDKMIHERMHGSWAASFLMHHPLGVVEGSKMLLISDETQTKSVAKKLHHLGAEVLVEAMNDRAWWMEQFRPPDGIRLITMAYSEEYPKVPGLDQRDDLLGAHAFDMVMAQFHRRETGVPENPKVMLCQGSWHD